MDPNVPAEAADQSQTPTPPEAPVGAGALAAEIADRIKGSTDVVFQKLIGRYADKEIDARVNLLEKGYEQLRAITAAKNRVKADVVHYDAAGKKTGEHFTKAVLDAKTKIEQGHKKLDDAITAAVKNEPGAFDKLKDAIEKTKALADKAPKAEAAPADAEA